MEDYTKNVLGPFNPGDIRPVTWGELKTFVDGLVGDAENQSIRGWGEEFSCKIVGCAWPDDNPHLMGSKKKDTEAIPYWRLRSLMGHMPESMNDTVVKVITPVLDIYGDVIDTQPKEHHLYYIEELLDDYINPSGEGCEPKAVYLEEGSAMTKEEVNDEDICATKGTLMLNLQ